MHCTLRTLTLMLLATVPVAAPVWAQAPALLTHHGYLSQAGAAVEGSIAITFALYDTATDAQFFWSEEVVATCAGGYYTVVLGSQVALDAQRLALAPALHLGLRIATDPELAPRLPVSSVPYALASDLAARAEIAHDLDCESCIAATEVAFSYAGSSAAGGPATALECQDSCVESAEIANGAVGTSKLAAALTSDDSSH